MRSYALQPQQAAPSSAFAWSRPLGQTSALVGLLCCASLLGLGGCANTAATTNADGTPATGAYSHDSDAVPPFARPNTSGFPVTYNRADTVAIALREWRLWGAPVADADPHSRPDPRTSTLKPERLPGLWQRVGEYWWTGMAGQEPVDAWTGRTDNAGQMFQAVRDGNFAWSAAFISYVMRIAGADSRFPYAPNHAAYIDIAAENAQQGQRGLTAHQPGAYAPQLGDLLCTGRSSGAAMTWDRLPAHRSYPAHCGIVVAVNQQGAPFGHQISIIGGNVDDSVALTHVPVDSQGQVSSPSNGASYDRRYPWLAILSPDYDASSDPTAGY
ncbi:DUF2272 domain-containing protein [Formicincola oecophyllae]|uniref:DUF2272 domain-containing protein n=1 Tax=Formicincola oecophyllae TaxID=2558361 RepID=A0A4Y6UAY5_9PROT|nr:DUF2272 domain-containing protein [Formicincola oecophyllae]QDH13738.1 DUF2272 domain-containing protein [Formicincola oecophyllae]